MFSERLAYDIVVGYMLKVIKSGAIINKFKDEFNAIKHGDYKCFISLVGAEIPNDVVVCRDGKIIPTNEQMQQKNVDFLFLILASPSLKKFYTKCYNQFGEIKDSELTNTDFQNLANFEMILRLFFNNSFDSDSRIELHKIIDIVLNDKGASKDEIEVIQEGRFFLNMIKGHKAKFPSIHVGLNSFNKSLAVLEKYEIVLNI